MISLKLYRGKVFNIDDPDKQGKIQIRIIPELDDIKIKDDNLPWFEPFFGVNGTEIKKFALKKDTLVWCLIDDLWKRRYYLGYFDRKSFFDYSKISDTLDKIEEISDTEYTNIDFFLYSEGSLDFFNNKTSEKGTIYKDGSYTFHDKDGNIIINTVTKGLKAYNDNATLEIKNTGEVSIIIGSAEKVIIKNSAQSLLTVMNELIDDIVGLTTIGSPPTHTLDPGTIAKLNATKQKLGLLLKE